MLRRLIAATVAALATVAVATPAHADTEGYWPTIWAPMSNVDGGEIVVQLVAPDNSWQIRHAARRLAAQVGGITVRTTGDCTTGDVCVHVVVDTFTPSERLTLSAGQTSRWSGLTTYDSTRDRTIYLALPRVTFDTRELRQAERRAQHHVAAHEFGHVLGLNHHRRVGLMSDVQQRVLLTRLSDEEIALLRATYGLS